MPLLPPPIIIIGGRKRIPGSTSSDIWSNNLSELVVELGGALVAPVVVDGARLMDAVVIVVG